MSFLFITCGVWDFESDGEFGLIEACPQWEILDDAAVVQGNALFLDLDALQFENLTVELQGEIFTLFNGIVVDDRELLTLEHRDTLESDKLWKIGFARLLFIKFHRRLGNAPRGFGEERIFSESWLVDEFRLGSARRRDLGGLGNIC